MSKSNKTIYKDPDEYLPQMYGMAIHYVTQEEGMEVYEFDFLDSEGMSLWNCTSLSIF